MHTLGPSKQTEATRLRSACHITYLLGIAIGGLHRLHSRLVIALDDDVGLCTKRQNLKAYSISKSYSLSPRYNL